MAVRGFTLFQHNTRDGKVRRWECWAEGDKVHTRHGIDGGAMQEVFDIPGSKGKVDTKAYVSPEAQAWLVVERTAKKKREEGYRAAGEESVNVLDLSSASLPKNLVLPKPVKEMPLAKMEKAYGGVTELDFCFTRKRDGMMGLLVRSDDGHVRLLSRKMDNLSMHFPHIIEEASDWLPNGSMVAGELLADDQSDTPRTFKWVSKIVRSKPSRARAMQTRDWSDDDFGEGMGKLMFYAFAVFVWGGVEVYHQETCEQLLTRVGTIPEGEHVRQVEIVGCDDLDELEEIIVEEDWEGAVVYLRDGRMMPEDMSFGGKERRPKVYWKVKVLKEDDFIVADWKLGTGKNMNRLGMVRLAKKEAGGDGYVDYGWCGSGFSDEEREDWATDDFVGKVVTVKFDRFTEDMKLRFPRFQRLHLDKSEDEVVELTVVEVE
jgi:ATP-dependent DNA ligase